MQCVFVCVRKKNISVCVGGPTRLYFLTLVAGPAGRAFGGERHVSVFPFIFSFQKKKPRKKFLLSSLPSASSPATPVWCFSKGRWGRRKEARERWKRRGGGAGCSCMVAVLWGAYERTGKNQLTWQLGKTNESILWKMDNLNGCRSLPALVFITTGDFDLH